MKPSYAANFKLSWYTCEWWVQKDWQSNRKLQKRILRLYRTTWCCINFYVLLTTGTNWLAPWQRYLQSILLRITNSLQKKKLPFRHFAPTGPINQSKFTPHLHLYYALSLSRLSYPCFPAPVASVISTQSSQSTPSILRGLRSLCRRMLLSPSNPRVFYTASLAYGFFARWQRPFHLIYLSNKIILLLGHPGIFLNTLFLVYRKPYKAKLGLTFLYWPGYAHFQMQNYLFT